MTHHQFTQPSSTSTERQATRSQLAPSGVIKFGVVFAPEMSNFFVVKGGDGQPRGVTAELGKALATQLRVPIDFYVAPNSGQLTDALESGGIDVAFMPVDEERRRRVDFGPSYFVLQATGLVRGDSGINAIADLDKPNAKVAGIANTTTIRGTARALPSATIVSSETVGEVMEMLRDGRVDAVSLSRDVLALYQAGIPGSRILDGHLHSAGIAIAVPKNRPLALSYVSEFLENAKASGLVRKLFDDAGLVNDKVAPAESAN